MSNKINNNAKNKNKFYVTTPIYYVTAKPHLGSLYSTLLADVASRWYKLKNFSTFFLTGTDEHGQKIAEAANKAELPKKEFIDKFIQDFKETWKDYNIDYNYFIRTTDQDHIKSVQTWLKNLIKKGDIYKSFYRGFYCTPCETYVTEKEDTKEYKPEETVPLNPLCPECDRQTEYVSEESYFFKLSKYQDKLLKFYEENPDFIVPSERLNEVISFVKSGLRDLSISRTTVTWGIPFPGDNQHVTYVWADALNNYITAIGYGDPNRQKEFNYWWPADLQILGKDILRFHAVYWPAFLMASDLKLPKKLLVHGWIKVNNQKMSKSFGNAIDPKNLLDTYGADPVRYYLVRHMAITQDSEFSITDLEQRINSDLANDLGNLLNRMIALSNKRNLTNISTPKIWSDKSIELRNFFLETLELVNSDMQTGYYSRAVSNLWKFISQVNAYFHSNEPWKIKDLEKFEEIISATAHSLYSIAILLWPVMPTKSEQILTSLNLDPNLDLNLQNIKQDLIKTLEQNWDKTFKFTQDISGPLFKKYDIKSSTNLSSNISPKSTKSSTESTETSEINNNININEFAKVMLLVGTIESCEEIPKSDKMYKLQVDFGSYGIRQILSGIKKHFTPEDLINKQGIFVYNLAPRKMLGLESQGMMLFAQKDNKLVMATVAQDVPNGTRLK